MSLSNVWKRQPPKLRSVGQALAQIHVPWSTEETLAVLTYRAAFFWPAANPLFLDKQLGERYNYPMRYESMT